MDIGSPIRWCGELDIAPLVAAIAAQGEEAWNEHEQRQKDYEVHRQTQSIVLLFAELEHWPVIEVIRQPGWDRLAAVAVPLMDSIIARWYPPGGRIIRAMVAKLPPGGRIDPHRDTHPSFACGHRIHAPIATNERVRFTIDGRPHHLKVGQVYEVNNKKVHSVINKGTTDRIHFIFDYVPVDKEPTAPKELPA
jgi:quercetin dioxygenase-like cupin family protein